jgi:hypothetical protein
MQAALAEMALEDLTKEADDDVDFLNAHGAILRLSASYYLVV